VTGADRDGPLTPACPAYVIYTSGSTGQPKGVIIEHRNLVSYLAWARAAYPGTGGTAWLHSSLSFDLTVTSLLVPLAAGGCVHVAALEEEPPAGGVSFLKATPSHLPLLAGGRPARGELVLGGEALLGTPVDQWRREHPQVTVVNEYGPTEATVGCAEYRVEPGDRIDAGAVPIGRPVADTRLYVLDGGGGLVPAGVAGELCIAGAQVARGYLNRPGLTAERFVPDPFGVPGSRMYRSGDLARWRAGGTLEFLGRADEQVKIRGFRIEPGEIAAVLGAHPAVADAAVVARQDRPGDLRLVAYLVAAGAERPGAGELRAWAGGQLPHYMVPAAFAWLDALPLTPNGKLDRNALPAPRERRPAADRPESQPAGQPVLAVLCDLFAELLDADEVDPDDGFFELGGHSMLAVELARAIAERFGVELPIRTVFEKQTPAELADALRQARPPAQDGAPASRQDRKEQSR
jgi:acyl-CoA synthetase (AMP-forming)/AMP-acid ligase II/acyl carrier protein